MNISIETITPAMAAALLKTNQRNRKLNEKLSETYARDMTAGQWALNGEAIKIGYDADDNELLLDGQHRLDAIVRAGIPVTMVIVRGLDETTQATMDAGRKRTAQDVLTIGSTSNASIVAAVAIRMIRWDAGDRRLGNAIRPTTPEILRFVEQNPAIHRSAEVASRTRKAFQAMPASTAGLAHMILSRVDQGETAEFFAHLQTGANLDPDAPMLLLRNRFMRDAAERRKNPDNVRLGLVIRTWNAIRTGEELGSLVFPADRAVPDPK